MSLINMMKDGQLIQVDESCVESHQEAGWRIPNAEQQAQVENLNSLADVMGRLAALEVQASNQTDQINSLESDVVMASDDSTPDDAALVSIRARVADLDAKIANGTATQADKMLRGRLVKKIPA